MKNLFFVFLLLQSITVTSLAEVTPKGSQYDTRMQTINFNPYDVTKINAMQGYVTSLIFNQDEVVQDIAVGFTDGWEVVDSKNVVYLKPIAMEQDGFFYDPWAEDWATNLVIRTNKNVYALDLNLVENKKSSAYTVKFNYPLEEKALREKAQVEAIKKHNDNLVNEKLNELTYPENWDYTMKVAPDSRPITPNFAYDDGTRTYLGFDSTKSIPAIFYYQGEQEMMSNNSVKQIPNFTIIIIHKTAERFILRSGDQTVGVINGSYGRYKPSNHNNQDPAVIRGIK